MSVPNDTQDRAYRQPENSPPEVAITFVVPVFDKAEFLDECLHSIRAQSLPDFEIICINDASTDSSAEILRVHNRSDERVRLLEHASNKGAGASRNAGIDMARGRYVRFVDADDLLPQDSSETMYERALRTHADVVRGSLALFRGADTKHFLSVISVPDREITTLRAESKLWIPWWHTSYLISRDLLYRNNLRYPSLRQGEDPVFVASVLMNATRISLVEDIVYLYRKYRKSTGSGQSTFASICDLLEHATLVKSMFDSNFAECWHEGYGPFLLDDFRKVLSRSKLNASQMDTIATRAKSIWECFQAP